MCVIINTGYFIEVNAIMKILTNIKITLLFLTINSLSYASPINTKLRYESLEHLFLGHFVVLKFIDKYGNIIIEPNGGEPIKLVSNESSSYALSFPDIVYLAGDFIADPTLNISGYRAIDSYSEDELRYNFIVNFNYFDGWYQGDYVSANKIQVGSFLPEINAIVMQELLDNTDAILNNKPIKVNDDLAFNCATGGQCDTQSDLITKKGLYMMASSKGGDHFGVYAETNYITGHKLAMELAASAKNSDDLRNAYAYEAYANHYLTDSFAAGHLRTPITDFMHLQNEMALNVLEPIIGEFGLSKDDVLLSFAKFMHDTENKNGLWIRTQQNMRPWISYGDAELFVKENNTNVEIIQTTMQHGVDQVFEIYKQRNNHDINKLIMQNITEMKTWLPDLDFVKQTPLNQSPDLFVINGYLYENGYRDWSNGSAGSICVLFRHLDTLISDKALMAEIQKLASSYCYNTIQGFAKSWDWVSDNSNIIISSNDGIITSKKIGNWYHVGANTHNQQELNVKPIISDNNGNSCTFKLPIKLKRYGMYTSLDEADGNGKTHRGVTISGSEYLDCTGSKKRVYYQASYLNEQNYFGFINKLIS